jgi:enolase-phosphatase E1
MSEAGMSESRMSEATSAIKLYLLDVEGTTSPVSLVYEQLFPFARRHLSDFLLETVEDPEVVADLKLLAEEYEHETDPEAPKLVVEPGERFYADDGAIYLKWLMDKDRKSTALKSIQGKIWKFGFMSEQLTGTMFPDVADALRRWNETAKVAIYSSGSVEAQQLLFRYSSDGDLTGLITSYFDTRVGAKTSPDSYRAIAEAMHVAPEEVLFISDVVRELDPAREAGCQTRLSMREGNAAVEEPHEHLVISSFADVE